MATFTTSQEPCSTAIAFPFTSLKQAQQAFWDRWGAIMDQGVKPQSSAGVIWMLPVEFWKAAIYSGLEAQLATAEVWKAWFCANDAHIPELTFDASQALEGVEAWTRAQMQLWESWFAVLESLTPGVMPLAKGPDGAHHTQK